jgi:dUTP pyrophosphatase
MNIKVKYLDQKCKLTLGSQFANCYDLRSASHYPITIKPGQTVVIGCGVAFEFPVGVAARVHSRSGLAAKSSISILNDPGIIDNDYTGEVTAILHNHGSWQFTVKFLDRIAQIEFYRTESQSLFLNHEVVDELGYSERGENGLGSTGVE